MTRIVAEVLEGGLAEAEAALIEHFALVAESKKVHLSEGPEVAAAQASSVKRRGGQTVLGHLRILRKVTRKLQVLGSTAKWTEAEVVKMAVVQVVRLSEYKLGHRGIGWAEEGRDQVSGEVEVEDYKMIAEGARRVDVAEGQRDLIEVQRKEVELLQEVGRLAVSVSESGYFVCPEDLRRTSWPGFDLGLTAKVEVVALGRRVRLREHFAMALKVAMVVVHEDGTEMRCKLRLLRPTG